MIIECIKGGILLANRNLQLVVIRIIASLVNLFAFGIFLGLPLIVAIAYFGFDIAHARDLLPSVAGNPVEFISRYLGLALMLVCALLLYLGFSSLLILYTLSGTLGLLKNSFINAGLTFSLTSFFKEANLNFSRLFWLVSLVFLGIASLLILFALTGGITALVLGTLSASDSTISMFLRSFTVVFLIIFGVVVLVASVIFSVYSAVISVVERKRAMESLTRTFAFLKNKPQAMSFFIVISLLFIAGCLLFFTLQLPLRIIPLVGFVMFFINAFFTNYLAVILWGSLITYYMRSTASPVYDAGYEI